MTDKALEAAARAIASEMPLGKMDRASHVANLAISAYLDALPGEAEVVGLVERLRKGPIAYQSPSGPIFAGPDTLHREAADALQAMQARAEKAERERDEMVETANAYAHQAAKAEIALRDAEARVKELEEALEPFADFGEFMEVETEGFSDLDHLYLVPEESDVRIGDVFVSAFRRARTALKGGSNG